MMPIAILLSFLVSFLPSSTIGKINNEHLDILSYASVRASEAGINPISFIKLINCESKLEKLAKGDCEEGKCVSQGILQFQKPTYDMFAKKYGLVGSWLSPYSQINLAAAIISREKNGWKNWLNCGKNLKF